MTIILLWLRFLFGIFMLLFAMAVTFGEEKDPFAATASFATAIALFISPRFKVRGQANLLASDISSGQFFTVPYLLASLRWVFGLGLCVSAAGSGLDKVPRTDALPMLLMGLILISPLDRLVFANLRFPLLMKDRQKSTAIVVARNIAMFLFLMALSSFWEKDRHIGITLLGIAGAIFIVVAVRTPGRLIIPRPVSPTFSMSSIKSSRKYTNINQALFQQHVGEAGVSPKLKATKEELATLNFDEVKIPKDQATPGAKKEKPKKYSNAYKVGWTATLNITEEKFNHWLRKFENDWLEVNQYRHRLNMHRNPNEFKNQFIKELNEYIQEIRNRAEMSVVHKNKPKVEYVPDLVSNTFLGDKQVRSLYKAVEKYCAQPNAKPMWSIGAHIAEYRAMINLVKKIKRSQLAKAKQKLAQSNHTAPSLSLEQLAKLSDENYFKIIDYIILLGKNLENYKELNENFDEELFRDYFLAPLNTLSPHYSAKGEVFNRKGKTDILVFDNKGNNIFVAECKCWKGATYLIAGVDQLLNLYVNWRDEKAAIIIFNQNMKKFSELIRTATEAMAAHPLCLRAGEKRTDTSWSFLFRHPDDEQRTVKLELILFNFT